MFPKLEDMQIKAIEVEIKNLMNKVRERQLELDEYRQQNTLLIETIMSNKTQESINDYICFLANDWVQSYLHFQIIGLKAKVNEIKQVMENENNVKKVELFEEAKQKNQRLKENKESLMGELKKLQEELAKEKLEIKVFLDNNCITHN